MHQIVIAPQIVNSDLCLMMVNDNNLSLIYVNFDLFNLYSLYVQIYTLFSY